MSTRTEIVSSFYDQADEDSRLRRSRHGQLEYAVTMHYIHRFAGPGSGVLEIGAGTGRYSVALAREGMDVTAVELVEIVELATLQKALIVILMRIIKLLNQVSKPLNKRLVQVKNIILKIILKNNRLIILNKQKKLDRRLNKTCPLVISKILR